MSLITFHKTETASYAVRFRYEALRSLLKGNVQALRMLGDLEADLNHALYCDPCIVRPVERLIHDGYLRIQELNLMTGHRHDDLQDVLSTIHREVRRVFETQPDRDGSLHVLSLDSDGALDHRTVGTKAFMLARLRRVLPSEVPPGFVLTAGAYGRFLDENGLNERIRLLMNGLDDRNDPDTFRTRIRTIREWIMQAAVPEALCRAVEAAAADCSPECEAWAVRSSVVDGDLSGSFAAQFQSLVRVKTADLADAYRRVLAGRFSDQAVSYRIRGGFREVKTPMAVLIMPMIPVLDQGSVLTRDMARPRDGMMVVHRTLSGGKARAVHVDPDAKRVCAVSPEAGRGEDGDRDDQDALAAADLARRARALTGEELHIEWIRDRAGAFRIVQAYRLDTMKNDDLKPPGRKGAVLAMGGVTIFPGRAEGNALYLQSADHFTPAHKGSVVIVDESLPEFGPILPDIAALLVIGGRPDDALSTLCREWGVPALFGMGPAARRLAGRHLISVNTMKGIVYEGSRWRGIRDRVLTRLADGNRTKGRSPLYDHLLKVTLSDPDDSAFKARNCSSFVDVVLFMHEMAVRSMFGFGDRQTGIFNPVGSRLKTDLPLKCQVIDINQAAAAPGRKLAPEEVDCPPFQALWRGLSDPGLVWTRHFTHEMAGLHRDLKNVILETHKGPRRESDMNYVIVSGDAVNVNARLHHHYMMVDSHVGPGMENNYIHVRFRAGGGIPKNRTRCVSFMERVLGRRGFGTGRNGDIVTAWIRCYGLDESTIALEDLGRLMVCVRELDAILKNDADIARFVEHFLSGSYAIFA
ncbi:PEP/pyruvate-binding domain-containing protein [Desulfatiferula olefinivorans]